MDNLKKHFFFAQSLLQRSQLHRNPMREKSMNEQKLAYLRCNIIYAHKWGHNNRETKGVLSFKNDSLLWPHLWSINYITLEINPKIACQKGYYKQWPIVIVKHHFSDWIDKVYIPTNHQRLLECNQIVCDGLTRARIPYLESYAGLFVWADFREVMKIILFNDTNKVL